MSWSLDGSLRVMLSAYLRSDFTSLVSSPSASFLDAVPCTAVAVAASAASRAALYPKLNLFVNYRIDAQEDGTPTFFGQNEFQRGDNLQAGIRLEVPVWQGHQRYSRMAQRGLQVRQRQEREELAQQRTQDEIRTLLAQLLEARQRARAQKRAVGQAQRGFDIASAEFRNGLGTQLNATDAEIVAADQAIGQLLE